jgi:hypothetical protein
VRRLDAGESGFYLGEVAGALAVLPMVRVLGAHPVPPDDLGELVDILSR